MGVTGNFFEVKREWSNLKDQILDHYLRPYLAKILTTGRPTRIADCFAGKGVFDDGSIGSPIIIADHVRNTLAEYPNADLKAIFIEQKYADDLLENLAEYQNCKVLPGDYEERLRFFAESNPDRNCNYFFYVDPYGVKNLSFDHFRKVKDLGFASLELLLNLNTTGFLREGCRLLSLEREMPDWAAELDYERDRKNTIAHMDEIAGGVYWKDILLSFQKNEIDFQQAEERFTECYKQKLGRIFQYVVDIPIKERSHHMPKYRLVFAGDHQHGFLLMADEMNKAWRDLLGGERYGQLYLFQESELVAMQVGDAQDLVWAQLPIEKELGDLLSELVTSHGIVYSTGEYKAAIREYEGVRFSVLREPSLTPKRRRAVSMDQNKYRIAVSRLPIG